MLLPLFCHVGLLVFMFPFFGVLQMAEASYDILSFTLDRQFCPENKLLSSQGLQSV